jgi:hypothetical protein
MITTPKTPKTTKTTKKKDGALSECAIMEGNITRGMMNGSVCVGGVGGGGETDRAWWTGLAFGSGRARASQIGAH